MEALSDLKNAIREIEEEDIAARLAERRGGAADRREQATDLRRESTANSAGRIGTSRRRFMSATIALAMTAVSAIGHGAWTSIASVQKPRALATPETQNYYRYLEAVLAAGGVNAIQSTYSGATRSEAIKCIRWVRERKVIPAYGFLVSCMSDPRVEIRALAVYEALRIDPRDLKMHIGLLQATLATETDVDQQAALATLIANVQNA